MRQEKKKKFFNDKYTVISSLPLSSSSSSSSFPEQKHQTTNKSSQTTNYTAVPLNPFGAQPSDEIYFLGHFIRFLLLIVNNRLYQTSRDHPSQISL